MKKINRVTDEHRKAMQWCLKNNIKVYINPSHSGLKVEINDNGRKICSPKYYNNEEALNKCWELYLYLYNKYWTV